jgi:hypothetical protein
VTGGGTQVRRACGSCGDEFEAHHRSARYCSGRCRKRASRGHVMAVPDVPTDPPGPPDEPAGAVEPPPGRLSAATRAELAAVSRVESSAGQQALMLAERLDAGQDTGSGIAALSRELRATMVVAMADAHRVESELDKLRRRNADWRSA